MEMMVALTVAGILMSLGVPRMEAMIRRERVRGVTNRLAVDLEYTRMLAVRNGSSAVLRFVSDPRCPRRGGAGYRVGMLGRADALRTWTADPGVAVCLETNNADSVVYNSRGLLAPFNNRTVWAVDGSVRDSLTVSVAGRVLVRR
jgi:Tfp pilus assembly protein FimT